MKTVIIYGIEHKGSTYNVVQLFKKQLNICDNDLTEFFLPKDMPHFCVGCYNCFMKGEEFCPHQDYVTPIKEAIWNADLLVLASPAYVLHVTGQMKAFLDHFAFQFMLHRPDKSMFSKTALVVSTAAGGGINSTIKDITGSLSYWGVSRIFTFGSAVYATKWEEVTEKNRQKIERKVIKKTCKIKTKIYTPKPGLKTKGLFYIFRMMHKKFELIPRDKEHWKKLGWLGEKRPWKK
jgi:multimeric flavodoxin WrbA